MLRKNTKQELEAINKYVRAGSSKLIYVNGRCNPYKDGWISVKAKHHRIMNFNTDYSCFYSLKHPGNSIKVD